MTPVCSLCSDFNNQFQNYLTLAANAGLLELAVSPMGRLSLRRRAIVNLGGEGGLCRERVSSLETSWGSIESLLLLCSHTQTPRWPFPRLLLQWQLLSNNNANNVQLDPALRIKSTVLSTLAWKVKHRHRAQAKRHKISLLWLSRLS